MPFSPKLCVSSLWLQEPVRSKILSALSKANRLMTAKLDKHHQKTKSEYLLFDLRVPGLVSLTCTYIVFIFSGRK